MAEALNLGKIKAQVMRKDVQPSLRFNPLMNKSPKGVSSRKSRPLGSGPFTTFDSSDVTNVAKVKSSFNSIAIYHLTCRFSIKEDTVLRSTAASIMFYVVWTPHIIYLTL